tara:strand:- start:17923 stop:18093 length:171 start_codon:yes stop_codon:yes gene_type:complete
MAIINCVTESDDAFIEIRLSVEEAKSIISSWDLPLDFKQTLLGAVKCANTFKGGAE